MADEGTFVEAALAPGGFVSRKLVDFEERSCQIEMGAAVREAFRRGKHLIVEAPTGTGKSFAYLVPTIEATTSERARAVVSTHTINLQEQLLDKDVPFLRGVLPTEFIAVLVKGRRNYVCLRRLARAAEHEDSLFAGEAHCLAELARLQEWARTTEDGTLSDILWKVDDRLWDAVSTQKDGCLGKRCESYGSCFFQRARRRMANADILVVNHDLFMSDLVLRTRGYGFLPEFRYAVFDEAHRLEEVASRHLGIRLSHAQVRFLLAQLYSKKGKRKARGFLVAFGDEEGIAAVEEGRKEAESFFADVGRWLAEKGPPNGRVREPEFVEDRLSAALVEVGRRLAKLKAALGDAGDRAEMNSFLNRSYEQAEAIEKFVSQELPRQVYWAQAGEEKRTVSLHSSPIRAGELLGAALWDELEGAVLTSATLTVGKERSFEYLRKRLGLESARELALESPFDYARQVTIHVPRDLGEPGDTAEYLDALSRKALDYIRETQGRALVLFTSYRTLAEVHARIAGEIARMGITLFRQGAELPRAEILERFRKDETSVLFGAESFWQGIDVPGPALSQVIVVKLPFGVPDEPLTEARAEAIREEGGNPFLELALPEAVIRLKQGFGRLVRRRTDVGRVAILDTRIVSKYYGRIFRESLPPCPLVRD
ncbi:MAG: helicase C-terminal domain-containing protein [Planctomycetota bacterium]